MEIPLKDIAQVVCGKAIGNAGIAIKGINSLDEAGPGEISFYADRRYQKALATTKASAIMIRHKTDIFKGPQIEVSNPQLAYARVSAIFARPTPRYDGISENSYIAENCRIGENVSIYPNVYVSEGAAIGEETILFPGVFIGERVKVGERCTIHPNVAILADCIVGNDVIIHAGTVIGTDGFGFVRDGATSVKIPQIGVVQIDDHVELGANNCIDRAAMGKTWIKRGVKTDNLVQVAHNVTIGEGTVIVAQTGIAGSAHIGREVIIAGQAGIAEHIKVGNRAMIGPRSGVLKNVHDGEVVSGMPSMPHRLWLKISSLVKRLPEFNERLNRLEEKIKQTEEK